MPKIFASSKFTRVLWLLGLVLFAPSAPRAKTIMWLGNFMRPGVFQQGDIGGVDSIIVPGVPPGTDQGYYMPTGAVSLKLTRTTWAQAYIDTLQTLSHYTTWWSVPSRTLCRRPRSRRAKSSKR